MSSRRKIRSSQSMYHPGIALSHGISYNQRKGMILTRDTNLPHAPTKVFTSQAMLLEARKALVSGRVGYRFVYLDFDISLGAVTTASLSESNLADAVRGRIGMNKGVYAVWVNSFSVINTFSQAWPVINYVLTIAGSETFTVNCNSSTSGTGMSTLYYADFDTPVVYPLYSSQAQVSFPRFNRQSNANNIGEVHDITNATASQGAEALVRSAFDKGYTCIPFYSDDSDGNVYPYSTDTAITFDTTGLTQKITLRVYCNVLYYK